MREANTTPVRREAYTAPAYFIRSAELTFDLDPAVNAGQEPLPFAGEVAVLLQGRFSRTASAGVSWF